MFDARVDQESEYEFKESFKRKTRFVRYLRSRLVAVRLLHTSEGVCISTLLFQGENKVVHAGQRIWTLRARLYHLHL